MPAKRLLAAMFVQASGKDATRLPAELEDRAAERLRWLVLGFAVLFLAGIPLRWVAWRAEDHVLFLASSVISALLAGYGIMTFLALRFAKLSAQHVLLAGLAYEVALCFALALVEQVMVGFAHLPFRLSSVAVVLVTFPLVVPSPPRWRLLTTFLCAIAQPAALGLVAILARGRFDILAIVGASAPTFVVAGLAAWLGQVVHRLRLDAENKVTFGQYELVERLGEGGMGEVWKARHQLLLRPAALKLIRPEMAGVLGKAAKVRFDREAQATGALTSPHTVSLHDYGTTDDGTLYYAMELLDGIDLETLVKHFGPAPPERVLHIVRQVCSSLAEAHELGLVHRDIKPQNIVLCRAGTELDFVKLLDFGLVKPRYVSEDSAVSVLGAVSGTPGYIAPEHAQGQPFDGRADLYALGCVAYFLLTGQRVFASRNKMELMAAHLAKDPLPPSRRSPPHPVPPALDELVLHLLERDPEQRPASARELMQRVEALQRELPAWAGARADAWWAEHLPNLARPQGELVL